LPPENTIFKVMKKRPATLLTAAAILLSGCTQFDDGPIMSLYSVERRLEGSWYFDRVVYGGVDSSENYVYQQRIEFLYSRKHEMGAFNWYHNFNVSTTQDNFERGYLNFSEAKDSLKFTFVNLRTLDTTRILNWKINRLAYREFWLERTIKDTLKVEWYLWKWAL